MRCLGPQPNAVCPYALGSLVLSLIFTTTLLFLFSPVARSADTQGFRARRLTGTMGKKLSFSAAPRMARRGMVNAN
jgi:hypothetical protein